MSPLHNSTRRLEVTNSDDTSTMGIASIQDRHTTVNPELIHKWRPQTRQRVLTLAS